MRVELPFRLIVEIESGGGAGDEILENMILKFGEPFANTYDIRFPEPGLEAMYNAVFDTDGITLLAERIPESQLASDYRGELFISGTT